MAFIVAEPCIKCKYTDCAEVCPVNCFYEGPNMLVINPDECIDCGACVPVCPVNAIYAEGDLPEKWSEYTKLNAELCAKWPQISRKKDPLPDAEKWKDVAAKRGELDLGG
ncbi:MAG TPA: ferredoxin FdxA [Anaeromyxobacteraceae bacterium]|nr:ferredoxin FdxA [Anaeromyxobacteraceae bacterium]